MFNYKSFFTKHFFNFEKKVGKKLTIILLFTFSLSNAQPPDYVEVKPDLELDGQFNPCSAHLEITTMNFIYVGVDNPLKIVIPNSSETYSLSSPGLTFVKEKTKYEFIVRLTKSTVRKGLEVKVLNSKGIVVGTKKIE